MVAAEIYQQEIIIRIQRDRIANIDLAQLISYGSNSIKKIVIIVESGARVVCHDRRGGDCAKPVMRSIIIQVKDGAHLEYIDLQDWAGTVREFSVVSIMAGENSTILYQGLYTGAWHAKVYVAFTLNGRYANAQICIGSILKYKTYHCIESKQRHMATDTVSRCVVKSAVYDSAVSTYDGTIDIDADAQRSRAYQKHKSLLVGDCARSCARPSFEIYANDVHCGHGSAIGQLDVALLFYLESRGICKQEAQKLLEQAFFSGLYSNTDLQQQVAAKINGQKALY